MSIQVTFTVTNPRAHMHGEDVTLTGDRLEADPLTTDRLVVYDEDGERVSDFKATALKSVE